jgi:uncharacterized membrane protein YuzA (DUF378 family)
MTWTESRFTLNIGGLNWGSIGIFRCDYVAFLFGGKTSLVSSVI